MIWIVAIVAIVGALLALLLLPAFWVHRVMERYAAPADRYAMSGAALARRLLDRLDLGRVGVEITDQGDHYDPEARTVRLSERNYRDGSLTAITVAAREVGHALQDHLGFVPLRLRGRLVRVAMAAQKAAPVLRLAAPLLVVATRSPRLGLLAAVAAFGSMLLTTAVHLVTLPAELDASFGRALPLLRREGVLHPGDEPHARRLLTAAAFTYVAAAALSLLSLARWLPLLRR